MASVRYATKFCKGCNNRIEIPETLAGRYIRCEKCGREVRCPSPGSKKYSKVRATQKYVAVLYVLGLIIVVALVYPLLAGGKESTYWDVRNSRAKIKRLLKEGNVDEAADVLRDLKLEHADTDDARVKRLLKECEKDVRKLDYLSTRSSTKKKQLEEQGQ